MSQQEIGIPKNNRNKKQGPTGKRAPVICHEGALRLQ